MILQTLLVTALATLPSAPKPHLDKVDFALLSGIAASRSLDLYTTRYNLERGDGERFLPLFIANHTPALAAFEASMVGADYLIASTLTKHHHPKLAKAALLIDLGSTSAWVTNNFVIGTPKKTGFRKP